MLFVAKSGGRFILRFDDTNTERSKEEFVQAIREGLQWLGLTWDEEVRQSQRLARYDEGSDKLKAEGLRYPCY